MERAARLPNLEAHSLIWNSFWQVQYDGDLDIEIDEEDLKMDGPLLDKLRD